jgi:Cu(I)/Ag(I) efflux system membrane protein CusA/SilA
MDKNGTGEVTGGIVVMRMGENAKAVIDRVKAKIEEISPGLPTGVKIGASYDRSDLIEASIMNLLYTLLEEALIVTLVVMLFLFHLPSALRILVEIPVSVLIAFLMMRMFGISSNIMSLGGIAIGIGVLVDASIVLLENAHRHLADAQERKEREGVDFNYAEVVILSTKQVARPIFFSILIIVISFLPVFMLTGQEGKLFHPLAFTKTFSLLGSAIVSITLVPVLMTLLMKGRFHREEKNPASRLIVKLYRPVIHWVLRHRKTTIAINVVALLVSLPIAMRQGSEFMPALDEGSLLFMPTMMPNVSMREATRVMTVQDSIIKAYPEVHHVLGKVGKAETSTDPAPVSMIETIILLKPKEEWREGLTKDKIVEELNSALSIPGVANGWTQPIINRINMLSTGVRTDLGIKIFGSDLDTLERLAILAEAIVKHLDGAADVVAERVQGGTFLDVRVDQGKAARYGLTSADINAVVEGAIGGENVSTLVEGRQRFPINVRYMGDYRNSIEEISKLPIPVRSGLSMFGATVVSGSTMQSGMGGEMSGDLPTGNGMDGMSDRMSGTSDLGYTGSSSGFSPIGSSTSARPSSWSLTSPRRSRRRRVARDCRGRRLRRACAGRRRRSSGPLP